MKDEGWNSGEALSEFLELVVEKDPFSGDPPASRERLASAQGSTAVRLTLLRLGRGPLRCRQFWLWRPWARGGYAIFKGLLACRRSQAPCKSIHILSPVCSQSPRRHAVSADTLRLPRMIWFKRVVEIWRCRATASTCVMPRSKEIREEHFAGVVRSPLRVLASCVAGIAYRSHV